jgi:predicted mannosyl-3-phosphoglycerate phosphatase (HAD superfamily)
MYIKVYEVLQAADSPLTKEEVAEMTGLPMTKVALNLLRLREEGKIQSFSDGETTKWAVKSASDDEKKMEKRMLS